VVSTGASCRCTLAFARPVPTWRYPLPTLRYVTLARRGGVASVDERDLVPRARGGDPPAPCRSARGCKGVERKEFIGFGLAPLIQIAVRVSVRPEDRGILEESSARARAHDDGSLRGFVDCFFVPFRLEAAARFYP